MTARLPDELVGIDPYLRPIMHMSPFTGKLAYAPPVKASDEQKILARCAAILADETYNVNLTRNGREALNQALMATVRSKQDVVSIITPSNCGYVSSCVTKEIEKFCRWKFGPCDDAAIVVLVHEFGRFAENPAAYRTKKLPVIEDCAYAMVDRRFADHYGKQGDFIVYSLAKAFPLQYGGLLITKSKTPGSTELSKTGRNFLLQQLAHHIENLHDDNKARAAVYKAMQACARAYGIEEVYPVQGRDLAHSFIARLAPQHDAAAIKAYMNGIGVESSIFYGGDGYFLPCHQTLNEAEIEYCFAHLQRALTKNAMST